MISKGASSGIVITDQQLNGKGQRGRKWVFQAGKSEAFSFFSNHDIDSNKIGYLPILSGLAVNNTLTKLDISSQLKWPNDIIVNGKKIGGILCESTIRKKFSSELASGKEQMKIRKSSTMIANTLHDLPQPFDYVFSVWREPSRCCFRFT